MSPLLHSHQIQLHTAELARNTARHHEVERPARAKRSRNPLRGFASLRVPRPA